MTAVVEVRDPMPTRLLTNAAALGVSKAFGSGLLLMWQLALARGLGADAYGVYGTIGALMAVAAALPDLGMGTILVRDVARWPERGNRYLGTALSLQSVGAALAYGLVETAAFLLGYDLRLRALLFFVGANLLVDVVGTSGHNQLVAMERMVWTAAISVGHVVVLVGLGSIALLGGGDLWGIYLAIFAAGLARAAAYWIAVRKAGWRPGFRVDRGVARRLFTNGLPLGVAALTALAVLHADKLVTSAMIGPAATGQLTAAFVLVFGIVDLFGSPLLVAALPAMARAGQSADVRPPHAVFGEMLVVQPLIGIPAATLLAVYASNIVTLLFGGTYAAAAPVLSVMAWCIVTRMIEAALAQILTVQERQRVVLVARAAGLAINLSTTIVLLPRVGVVGAAAGMLAGESAAIAAMSWVLAPPAGWWRQVASRFGRLLGPTAALAAALAVFSHRLPPLVVSIAGLIAYAGGAAAAGALTREHRELVLRAVRQKIRP
jgi:O-antigen/teichoic acid export membrane protein